MDELPGCLKPDLEKYDEDIQNAVGKNDLSLNDLRKSPIAIALIGFCLFLSLFHLYTAAAGSLIPVLQRSIHVVFAMMITLLLLAYRSKTLWFKAACVLLSAAVLAIGIYIWRDWERISINGYYTPTQIDIILGVCFIVILLYCLYRNAKLPFVLLILAFLSYFFVGPYFKGTFAYVGLPFDQVVAMLFMNPRGIWGGLTGTSATELAPFLVFGCLLAKADVSTAMINLVIRKVSSMQGGPAKVAVVTSSLCGLIQGSATSNVATTGVITIPLMKSSGYRAETAGAVEAAASTGGQIVPPVLGSVAFLMMQLLGVSYTDIMRFCITPAIIYYAGVYFSVHYLSLKEDIKPVGNNKVYQAVTRAESVRYSYLCVVFALAVGVILFFLLAGYTPRSSCFNAICIIILSMLLEPILFGKSLNITYKEAFAKILNGLINGAEVIASMAIMVTSAQIIVNVMGTSSLGLKFGQLVFGLSDSSKFLSLVVAALLCTLLGMGMPNTPAYLLTVITAGTALLSLGVPLIQTHMFVFYISILSSITPPVCMGVIVASKIARCDWLKCAKEAMVIALCGMVAPFMFIYFPELLNFQPTFFHITMVISSIIGCAAISGGMIGFVWEKLSWWRRILLIAAGISLITPNLLYTGIGIVAMILILKPKTAYKRLMRLVNKFRKNSIST